VRCWRWWAGNALLAQLATPVAALMAFAARRQPASFAVAASWLGVNVVVGRHAADGDARVLPLLAPDADSHDWWNMLGRLGRRWRGLARSEEYAPRPGRRGSMPQPDAGRT
jgi:hypothetical protein